MLTSGISMTPTEASKNHQGWSSISLQKVGWVIAVSALVFASLYTLHVFFSIADRAVPLAVDDSLANVSVSLSKLGRYGLLTMPTQEAGYVRTHGFYNYGPGYFVLGAAFDWLFGTSYLVQQSLHPLILVAIPFLALAVFGRETAAGAALLAALLIMIFWKVHWPMVRPDIVVNLFACLGMAATMRAVRTDSTAAWCTASFCISCAAVTHQIAGGLVLGTATVWIITRFLDAPRMGESRRTIKTFAACLLGGLLGLLTFAVAIEFRFADLLHWYSSYIQYMGSSNQTWLSTVSTHLHNAWYTVPPGGQMALSAGVAATAGLLFASPLIMSATLRLRCLSILLPPLVLGASYVLSLGFYRNFHAGYLILIHVMTFWSIAAGLTCALLIALSSFPRFGRPANFFVSTVVSIVLVWVATHPAGQLLAAAERNVSTASYIDRVIGNFPRGSWVWGDPIFGIDPTQIKLVRTEEALAYAKLWKPEYQRKLVPEYLIAGWIETRDFVLEAIRGDWKRQDSPFEQLPSLFPDTTFKLTKIVLAPPYGATRVYATAPSSDPEKPAVSISAGGAWSESVGASLPFSAEPVPPITFDLRYYSSHVAGVARRSIMIDMPAGNYLIEVALSDVSNWGAILLTESSHPLLESGDRPFDMDMAPYFAADHTVYLLRRHPGGPMYVSQFAREVDAAFSISKIYRVGEFVARPSVNVDNLVSCQEAATRGTPKPDYCL